MRCGIQYIRFIRRGIEGGLPLREFFPRPVHFAPSASLWGKMRMGLGQKNSFILNQSIFYLFNSFTIQWLIQSHRENLTMQDMIPDATTSEDKRRPQNLAYLKPGRECLEP
jgi:hypothetical protein